jgi:hypothetical protein
MAYPDTSLPNDVLDPDFGGQPAKDFGGQAWQWINAVVRFLSSAYLMYARAPYSTIVVVSRTSAIAGDVAVFVAGNAHGDGSYDVRKYVGSLATPMFAGIYLESVSVGAKARVAPWGVIPPIVTGFAAQGSAVDAGLNISTGRLRIAQTGDTVLGKVDLQGHTLLTATGCPLP